MRKGCMISRDLYKLFIYFILLYNLYYYISRAGVASVIGAVRVDCDSHG